MRTLIAILSLNIVIVFHVQSSEKKVNKILPLFSLVESIADLNPDWDPINGFDYLTSYSYKKNPTGAAELYKERGNEIVGFKFKGPGLENISPLSSYSDKKTIIFMSFTYADIEDLSALSGYNVNCLEFMACRIKNSKKISLPYLNRLLISESDLKGMNEFCDSPLKEGYFVYSPIRSSFLSNNWKLETLYLSSTLVVDLSPLNGQPLNMVHIDQGHNEALYETDKSDKFDLSPFAGCELKEITLNACNFFNFSKLKKTLTKVNLANTQLSTCEFLKGFENLTYANLSENSALVDISPLVNLPLSYLNLRGTAVNNIDIISSLETLKELRIDYTSVSDISPLSKCTKIEVLHLSNTDVSDLSPLKNCTSIKELSLDRTKVNTSSILEYLSVNSNYVIFKR